MRSLPHDLYRNYNTGARGGVRTYTIESYCTNPGCHHARRPHPITSLASMGSWWEPPDAGLTECPACDAPIDSEPLFDTDEEAQEERA